MFKKQERTMYSDVSGDDDDISLSSSVEGHDDDQEFEVERILAEHNPDDDDDDADGIYYLVKWTGFPMHQCTWEPESNIGEELKAMWEEDMSKMAPDEAENNVQAWYAAQDEANRKKEERHRKREQMRLKEGISITNKSTLPKQPVDVLRDEESEDEVPKESPKPPLLRPVLKQPMFRDVPRPPSDNKQNDKPRRASTDNTTSQVWKTSLPKASTMTPARPASSSEYQATARVASSTGYQGTARKQMAGIRINSTGTSIPSRGALSRNYSAGNPIGASNAKLTAKKSTQGGNNIFISGKIRKKRHNLNDSMEDRTREPKLFTKARIMRLAEKKSRDMEDRAPPPSRAHLYDISKGPPHLKTSGDGSPWQSTRSSIASDYTAPDAPTRQGTASSMTSSTLALESSKDPLAPPLQANKQVKKRKSVRFLETEHLVDEPTEIPMDLDDPRPVVTHPPDLVARLSSTACSINTHLGSTSLAEPPARKQSLNAYKAQKQLTQSRNKTVKLGGSQAIDVVFDGLPLDSSPSWVVAFLNQEVLEVSHACFAKSKDQVRVLMSACLCSGWIKSEQHRAALDASAENLRTSLLGLFYHHPEFSMVILPTKCDDWTGLVDQELSTPADISMSYKIFSPASEIGPMLRPLRQATETPVVHGDAPTLSSTRNAIMRKFFGFDYMALLPTHPKPKTDHFFLAFPRSQDFILNSLCQWLRANNPSCHIYLAQRSGAWAAFRSAVSMEPGVVIVHEVLTWTIHRFPGLDSYLINKQDTYWCFSEPNHPRPIFPSIMALTSLAVPGEPRLTRLLPHRTALLLTPSFLISEPLQAYEFLRWWLEKWSESTGYRLVTAHNFHEFLGELALEKMQAREDLLKGPSALSHAVANADMHELSEKACKLRHQAAALATEIHIISQLRTGPFGKQDDFGSLTYADPSINPNDEQSLVNWFGWWSSLRMDQFRKFCVVGSSKPAERRIRIPKYSRNSINNPDALIEVIHQRDGRPPQETGHGNAVWLSADSPVPHAGSAFKSLRIQSDSFASLKNVLAGIRPAVAGKPQWTLYGFPVSYVDFDMIDHFGESLSMGCKRISEWFDFAWSFVDPRFQGPRGFNTYIGLFYTITEDWDKAKIPKGPARRRHPWLAIYRPVNPHIRPYSRLELIIWDIAAPHKFPNNKAILREEELLDMQRRVIDYVREHGEEKNPNTVFERVWLGGFDFPQCDSPYPIDITLAFLDQLLRDLNNVLPATEGKLRKNGFRTVQLKTDPVPLALLRLNEPTLLDQPMDLESSDDEDQVDDEDAFIIFHPPRGRNLGSGRRSRCGNRLFEAQRLSHLEDPIAEVLTFKFSITEDWYKENRAEGRSYEHVHISPWPPLFKYYKIGPRGEAIDNRRNSKSA